MTEPEFLAAPSIPASITELREAVAKRFAEVTGISDVMASAYVKGNPVLISIGDDGLPSAKEIPLTEFYRNADD